MTIYLHLPSYSTSVVVIVVVVVVVVVEIWRLGPLEKGFPSKR